MLLWLQYIHSAWLKEKCPITVTRTNLILEIKCNLYAWICYLYISIYSEIQIKWNLITYFWKLKFIWVN